MTDLNILRIDASARSEGSSTRRILDTLLEVAESNPATTVVTRDVSDGLPFVTSDWIAANFTPDEDRTPDQAQTLSLSDSLIAELEAADLLVIGAPIYNFGIPASLKSWIDLIARARKTFRYTENGPVGLLTGKRAILVVASGGTKVDSDIDFATPYLRHALKFIGIDDVTVITADQQMVVGDEAVSAAAKQAEQVGATLVSGTEQAA